MSVLRLQLNAFFGGLRLEQRADFRDDGDDGAIFLVDIEAARFDLRQVENVVENPEQHPPLVADHLEHVTVLFPFEPREERIGTTEHGRERGADLVAHVGQEFAFRFAGGESSIASDCFSDCSAR